MVDGPVAFVLGGGGVLGAVEVGMLRALFRAGYRPDHVIGTSIGAVNGALVAADPSEGVTDRLVRLWTSPEAAAVYGDSIGRQVRRFAARTHLHSPLPLRRLLENELGEHSTFADLKIPFRCCAASIERAAEHWFDAGPLVDAVVASSAVPGLLPPMEIDGEHFVDGGIVNSIPIGEAVYVGARLIFVLQVGRIERPLTVPRRPWEVAQVAFEIARRHRFAREIAALPAGVEVHVLPSGGGEGRDDTPWAYRDMAAVGRRISRAYTASRRYLADHVAPPRHPRPADPSPAHPSQAHPVSADPVLAGRSPAGPVPVDPVSADPVLADPVLADPVLADPVLADPVLADPVLADPVPVDPVPVDPRLVGRSPAGPVLADPRPVEPWPADPPSAGSGGDA